MQPPLNLRIIFTIYSANSALAVIILCSILLLSADNDFLMQKITWVMEYVFISFGPILLMTTIMQLNIILPILIGKGHLGDCHLALQEVRKVGSLTGADLFMVIALMVISLFITFCYAAMKVNALVLSQMQRKDSVIFRLYYQRLKLAREDS